MEGALAGATDLIESLTRELRACEEFRVLLDSQALDKTAEQAALTAAAVQRINALMEDIFNRLRAAPDPLAGYMMSFESFCAERTRGFIGRDFLLDEIDAHLLDPDFESGYLRIRGEPGVGKSAFIAHIVTRRAYVHHFNIALQGVTSPESFLGNVSAQLVVRHELPYHDLPMPRATRDSVFFTELLAAAAERAARDGELPIVIAVDALDEADRVSRENVLRLPVELPDGVYILVTSRVRTNERLQADRLRDIPLDDDDKRNLRDVRAYIASQLEEPGHESVMQRLSEWNVDAVTFTDVLTELSEGNFMYLVHMLRDIRAGRVTNDNVSDIEKLPRGLKRYYELHWEIMRSADRESFRRYQEPVVSMLATAREPITADRILQWVNARPGHEEELSLQDVIDALEEWREFLDRTGSDPPTFRIYHASFREFLDRTVNLTQYRKASVRSTLAKIPPT